MTAEFASRARIRNAVVVIPKTKVYVWGATLQDLKGKMGLVLVLRTLALPLSFFQTQKEVAASCFN